MDRVGFPLRKADKLYTYGDYRGWPDDERWELIDGVAWNMSPAPSRRHQRISTQLVAEIVNFLRDKDCDVYHAPFDVMLPDPADQPEDEIITVVQPDISVICDRTKLTDKGCTGAPDWLVEILSPYTSKKDIDIKFHLYERHGVREYWLVDPGNKYVHAYVLAGDGKYPEEPRVYLPEDQIESAVLTGLVVDVGRILSE
jgi:Uma2 family endonuclease